MVAEIQTEQAAPKRGDINEDGLIYWGRGHRWVTPERFAQMRERHIASCRRTYERTKEDNKRLAREWYANHREHAKVKRREWRDRNPDKVKLYSNIRHGLKRANRPADYSQAMVNEINAWKLRLSKCLGIKFTLDHLVPLSLGGEHSHRNITPIPAYWNAKKHRDHADKVPGCWKREPQ